VSVRSVENQVMLINHSTTALEGLGPFNNVDFGDLTLAQSLTVLGVSALSLLGAGAYLAYWSRPSSIVTKSSWF
jgi:hypothetical protein